MEIADANALITSYLEDAPYLTILGLLPLSKEEEAQVTSSALAELQKWDGVDDLTALRYQLLYGAPAATAYTLTNAASQAIQPKTNNRFWEPFENKLSIEIPSLNRRKFANIFRDCCKSLNVLQPDASQIHDTYVAPFIAQAGIIHSHVKPLAKAIGIGLKMHLLPDLEDTNDVRRFTNELSEHIYNHPLLKKLILSEAGSILVHKLLVAHAHESYTQLPHHLRSPFKEAFTQSGGGVVLRTPHLTFSHAHGLVLRLPKQTDKLLNGNTYWKLGVEEHLAHETCDIPIGQLPEGVANIELRNLREFDTRSFAWAKPDKSIVHLFNEKTGREVTFNQGELTSVLPGNYCVVMPPAAQTNDSAYEETCGDWKLLQGVEIRPGGDPLTISLDGLVSTLCSELKASIHQLDDAADFLILHDDDRRLHFGKKIGLVACLPKLNQSSPEPANVPKCSLIINYGAGQSKEVEAVLNHHLSLEFDYIDNLESSLQEVTSILSAGLHELKVEVRSGNQSVKRRFWFWKGLNHFSKSQGFKCDEFPKNVAYKELESCGLVMNGSHLDFVSGFSEPTIRIHLNNKTQLTLKRPGVEMFLLDQEGANPERLLVGARLSIADDDSRQLIISSGGYNHWEVRANDELLRKLTPSRPCFQLSLSRLVAQFGESCRFTVSSDTEPAATLFTYTSELIGQPLEFNESATDQCWVTQIASKRIGSLRVKVFDYTDSLTPTPELVEFWRADALDSPQSADLRDGLCITLAFADEMLKLRCCFEGEALAGKFLLLSFEFQEAETDIWSPLQCAETNGKSPLTLLYDHPSDASAWSMLRKFSGRSLRKRISDDQKKWLECNIRELLATCTLLSAIKYPGIVFAKQAKHLPSLSCRLGMSIEHNATSLSIWYQQSVIEMAQHSDASSQVVVKRFLFSAVPQSLTCDLVEANGDFVSHISRSMHWGAYISQKGGRLDFAKNTFMTNKQQWDELASSFGSFDNSQAVMSGTEQKFSRFNASKYFKDIHKEISKLEPRDPDLDDAPILSPRHYMLASRQLKKSNSLLYRSSRTDPDHILNKSFHPINATHRALETMMRELNDKINFTPSYASYRQSDQNQVSLYPSIGFESCCKRTRQLADLAWAWALTVRLKAHGQISDTTYNRLYRALIPDDSGVYNSLNLVINYANELFAFYVALIDFAHLKKI